jgi:hypothetical protein
LERNVIDYEDAVRRRGRRTLADDWAEVGVAVEAFHEAATRPVARAILGWLTRLLSALLSARPSPCGTP